MEIKKIIYDFVLYKIKKKILESHPKDEWRMYTPHLLKYLEQCETATIIPKKSCNVVFVEFRELNYNHIKFILLNAYKKLGKNFFYTIVCGNYNYEFMKKVNEDIGGINKIIKVNINNCPLPIYNMLFFSPYFWEMLKGEKILIYQDDSIIYDGSLINDFMEYDYVGSPWPVEWNNNSKNVGNGGLSLRSKKTMLLALKQKIVHTFEDIFFSKTIIDNNLGSVPEVDIAKHFSMATIYTPKINMFGAHAWWTSMEKKVYKFDYCFSRIFKSIAIIYNDQCETFNKIFICTLDFFISKKYIIMCIIDNNTKKKLHNTLDRKYNNYIKYINSDYLYDEHFTEDLKVDYFFTIGMENENIHGLGKENIAYITNQNNKIYRPNYDLYFILECENKLNDLYEVILNNNSFLLQEYVSYLENI